MDNNERLLWFVKSDDMNCALIAGVELDSVIFTFEELRIRPGNTPYNLEMKENDTIEIQEKVVDMKLKVSLQSDIPNGMTFSLKFPDSFADIMKEYADRIGIDFNSVRFMYGEKRIKSGSNPLQLGIPPNAVIEVFKEYETITLEFVDGDNRDKTHQTQVNCGDSFIKILEDSVPFGMDPFSIELIQCGRGGITDEQTPKEREMDNNERIMVFKTLVINTKFVKSNDMSTITEIRVKHKNPLDNSLKNCAMIAGVELNSVIFTFRGRRIRPGITPLSLEMKENDSIEMQEKVVDMKLNFIGPDDSSKEVVYIINDETDLELAKNTYASSNGENINNLRFIFNGGSNTTFKYLKKHYVSKKCDTIFVERGRNPEKYLKLKVVGQDSNGAHFRVLKEVSMGIMKKTYADHLRESVSSLRFLFDGRRINDEDTPNRIEMEEDDIIEVYKEQFA